jgi:UPF0755 protein
MKKIFYYILSLFFVTLCLITVVLFLLFSPTSYTAVQKFVIRTGEGVNQISQHLYEQGLLRSRLVFETYVWYQEMEKKFIAGEYLIEPGLNSYELGQLLTSLDKPNELTLQFIEGWTIGDMADYLVNKDIIANQSEFMNVAQVGLWKQEFKFLAGLPDNETLEGYLFPDTYKFFQNSTSQDIIRKMLANFDTKFSDEMRVTIVTRGFTIHEVVKLASILEKEVKAKQDMKLVADIFNRRLAIGMLLQADSTLNYATKGKNASLTATELMIDNPYNSYKYFGLPPTPISNPGFNALWAAVYPEENEYYFFLTSLDGTAYYAKTLEEHTNNRQYLK